MLRTLFWSCLALACCIPSATLQAAAPVKVGFASRDVTPDVAGKTPVWIAGYGQNRRAKGVHDPLFARAIVIDDGQKKIALAAVDVVGLQYPAVRRIREKLKGFDYVLVASTHNHEGPDVVGIWGPTPFQSGIDQVWLDRLIDQTAEAINAADAAKTDVSATYGTAEDEKLLRDSREPYVKDGIIRVVRFQPTTKEKPPVLLVNWTCHPEALASENQEITADFPYYTIRDLEKRYGAEVIYFSGAVGGLMAPPRDIYKKSDGSELTDGSFEYCERYGGDVAKLAMQAIDGGQPLDLGPIKFAAKTIYVPLQNKLYRAAQMMGVLKRDGSVWSGDPEKAGPALKPGDAKTMPAGSTEVGYVGLGDLHIAGIPGELYPELVYGKVQTPADPAADFPDAPAEPSLVEILPGKKMMLFGLANDELGYIIPRRQWDEKPPFAYGRKGDQYGEGNSCGPDIAPILMKALQQRVAEATGKKK